MRLRSSLLLASFATLFAAGCSRDSEPTGPAPISTEARIFIDNFIAADFQAFSGSKVDAVQLDNVVKYRGSSSLRITVPVPSDPSGSYAGGAFVATESRNLAGYNAVSFYARASRAATLNVAGLANDNTGNSAYIAERNNIALTTSWQKYTVIIPLASRLSLEKGLFYFAEGAEGGTGYEFWIDDLRFENLPDVTNIRPVLAPATAAVAIGGTYQVVGLSVTAAVGGVDQTVTAAPSYFSFTSSTPATATVSATGLVTVLAAGTSNITASLGGASASGAVAVTAVAPPATAAPTPTYASADVISLFSNAYTNRTINTWSASWDDADVSDLQIAGNDTKRYTNLTFAGIEFLGANKIDATEMTHLRMDIWTPDPAAVPGAFKIKLVDAGADGVVGSGGDDRESEVSIEATTTPALVTGSWITLEIPLAQFGGLTTRANVSQMILSGTNAINTVYVDNVLFYKSAAPPPLLAPTTAAPAPTYAAGDVISLFSNNYTNVPVDRWSTDWDQTDVADVVIAGSDMKQYTNLTFAGIEFLNANRINATTMTHFRMDIWTPDASAAPNAFKIKLVDIGADAAFGGGDDREHELTFEAITTPALTTGAWITLDIPLTQFTGLTTRAHLSQLIISGTNGINTVFVDNVLFHR
jgi:hypothetical protein